VSRILGVNLAMVGHGTSALISCIWWRGNSVIWLSAPSLQSILRSGLQRKDGDGDGVHDVQDIWVRCQASGWSRRVKLHQPESTYELSGTGT
jgi:hypothetical protein